MKHLETKLRAALIELGKANVQYQAKAQAGEVLDEAIDRMNTAERRVQESIDRIRRANRDALRTERLPSDLKLIRAQRPPWSLIDHLAAEEWDEQVRKEDGSDESSIPAWKELAEETRSDLRRAMRAKLGAVMGVSVKEPSASPPPTSGGSEQAEFVWKPSWTTDHIEVDRVGGKMVVRIVTADGKPSKLTLVRQDARLLSAFLRQRAEELPHGSTISEQYADSIVLTAEEREHAREREQIERICAGVDENVKKRLHEVGDQIWAIAKDYARNNRKDGLTRNEIMMLTRASKDLHAIADPHSLQPVITEINVPDADPKDSES
jgi:hypothetical protein